MVSNDDLLEKLERWLVGRREPPNIFDVIATGDGELFAAFVLKAFRSAAAQAVADRIEMEGNAAATSRQAGTAVGRVLNGLARAWSLSEAEQVDLLGLSGRYHLQAVKEAAPAELDAAVLERFAICLDIFHAINTLLPEPGRADAWMRKRNNAPLFGGRSALQLMLSDGLPALRNVRAYLQKSGSSL